jgi:hypothetical protein
MSSIGTANSAVARRGPRSPGRHGSRGEHGRSRGARARPARGSGCPVRRGRTRVRSSACQPVARTPGEGAPRGFVKAGPRPGVAPVTARRVRPARPQGSCAHPLNTRPWVVIRESRHDHPRQVPLRAEATITCLTCGTHQTPVVLTGMPGSRWRYPRRCTNGPCMKARVSAWKMESGWPGAAPEHAPVSTPAGRRGYPGWVCGAPRAGTVRSLTGTPPRIPWRVGG